MNNHDTLDRLCRLCGIEPEYTDIWGKLHRAPEQIKHKLLTAMGVMVNDEASLRAALADREIRAWRRLLAPVQVVSQASSPVTIPITLPQARAREPLRWSLLLESGERFDGEVSPASLPRIEEAHIDEVPSVRIAFLLPHNPGLGYHCFEITNADGGPIEHGTLRLIVAPEHCYRPPALTDDGRVWGLAIQLYALRSKRNWGIGDLTDLRALTAACAEWGADIIGVNPLHALFPHNPAHASPYSPSSRLFMNILYIDIEAMPEFADCPTAQHLARSTEHQARLQALRKAPLVDYVGVATARRTVLEELYKHFRKKHSLPDTAYAKAFQSFQASASDALVRHCVFEALQEHFFRQDPTVWGWPVWPEAYRNPDSEEVSAFASANNERIEFFQYLQWHLDQQLAAIEDQVRNLGLAIGLYTDLAVSIDRGGAEAWANQNLYATDVSIGAPPDDFNLNGQEWGLPPFVPEALIESAYTSFIATLRANMRHAGALRIDHVMGLMRLFWIPAGTPPAEGAYVRYPFADLLGIVALESHRNRCLVIGEDLGTVPDEVRIALKAAGVLSYRVAYFEKDNAGVFKPPAAYPRQAVVAISTHDLPTLAGFWAERDLEERAEHNLFPSDEARQQLTCTRMQDRHRMLFALDKEQLLPDSLSYDSSSLPPMSSALAQTLHVYMARSPAQLMMVQLEDVLGQREQANLPGTTDQRPNWRYKLTLDLEDLVRDDRMINIASALSRERGTTLKKARAQPLSTLIPRATYRLQLNRDFTFAALTELVPYLRDLGISHCYCSSYLKARADSHHGYDIVDHNALNPEIGSVEDYERFVKTLRQNGLHQILDVVPNHMGVGGDDNDWWLDVLENGPSSTYACFFDIDWYPTKDEMRGKVLLPVLGEHYGQVLENGGLKLGFEAEFGAFSVRYYDHRFPIDPKTYPYVLAHDVPRLEQSLGRAHPHLKALQTLINDFDSLPGRNEVDSVRLEVRRRDKDNHKARLAALCVRCVAIREFIEANVNTLNGVAGNPASFDLLHALLDVQAYRPAYWRVAADEINYRRFFDINELAGLRMENLLVFDATHAFIRDLVKQGTVTGLRIDHPDGFYDPAQYFARLQDSIMIEQQNLSSSSHGTDANIPPRRPYVLAEKILASHEHLPLEWPIDGTTGYEFANLVNGLLVHAPSQREMDRIYRRFVGRIIDFDELLYERKKLIVRTTLASELNVLANQLNRVSESDRCTRDFTLTALRNALMEVVVCFPVYRTYVTADRVSAEDCRYVDWAIAQAKKHSLAVDLSIFDFIRDILLLNGLEQRPLGYRQPVVEFAMRFQQYTAPVMAKGLEDTSFYIYNRLVSLNEVGGDPRRFGISVAAFHRANQEHTQRWPHTMLCTSTHDTKRSEDVRARINVLSEIPDEWRQHVGRWRRVNRRRRRKLNGEWAPSANDEYLLYQTLVGAWPSHEMDEAHLTAFRERIEAYMLKAVKEAKIHTSWINPNTDYEDAVIHFVHVLLSSTEKNPFLVDFIPFVRRVSWLGMFNSLSQVLLKLTSPGVPDIYQGNEVWDFSLVDPDNRRPVDYARRQALLRELETLVDAPDLGLAPRVRGLLASMEDGRVKLYLTWRALSLRKQNQDVFEMGEYRPLAIHGPRADHLCAFARLHRRSVVITVVSRWFAKLTPPDELPLGETVWSDTWVEAPFNDTDAAYTNVLTQEAVKTKEHDGDACLAVPELLANFPVALLERAGR